MSVISRRVRSVPVRTSADTWTTIVDLLAAPGHSARGELTAIGNTAAMLIAEEYTRDAPIVVKPATGERIRIYTVHGSTAIEAETDEGPLATWPLATAGWTVSLPCGVDDIDDVRAALTPYHFVEVRDVTDGITAASSAARAVGRPNDAIVIDVEEMERP